MHSQYNIQYGTISYYNPIDCSGIVKSNKKHFFFDQSTIIPIQQIMARELAESQHVLYLSYGYS